MCVQMNILPFNQESRLFSKGSTVGPETLWSLCFILRSNSTECDRMLSLISTLLIKIKFFLIHRVREEVSLASG
jgi:hypothetical protein